MEIRETAREGCRFADDHRARPIRSENAGRLCVRLRDRDRYRLAFNAADHYLSAD